MGKKKPSFLWVREDQREEETSEESSEETSEETSEESSHQGRLDRSEHRAFITDLKDLANRLAKLTPGMRNDLPIDEDTHQQLELLVNAHPGPERRRALMHTKTLLGSADLDKINKFLSGETPAARLHREALYWRTQLLDGNDEQLQAFMQIFPNTDRQALRSLLREARKAGNTQAQTRLLGLLRDIMAPTTEVPEVFPQE